MGEIKVIGSPLYQWELGRKIEITPPTNTGVDKVEFSHAVDTEALQVIPKKESGKIIADIPNVMLQSGTPIFVYLTYTPGDSLETTASFVLPVIKRPKPTDYIYTETEVVTVERAVEIALEEAKESGDFKGDPGYTPVRGTDYWTEADKQEIVEDVAEYIASTTGTQIAYGWGELEKVSGYLDFSGKVVSHVNYVTSDFIEAIPKTDVDYALWNASGVGRVVAFYTAAKAFIPSASVSNTASSSSGTNMLFEGTVTVPEGATYFRVTDHKDLLGSFSYYKKVEEETEEIPDNIQEQIDSLYGEKSVTDMVVTVEDAVESNLRGVIVNDGTVVTSVKVVGRNLFHCDKTASKSNIGVTWYFDAETQEFVINGTTTGSGDMKLVEPYSVDWVEGEKYTVSVRHTGGTATLASGTGGTTYAFGIFASNASKFARGTTGLSAFDELYTFTATAFKYSSYIFYFQCWRPGTVFDNYRIKIQVERGTTIHEWEPYEEVSAPIADAKTLALKKGYNNIIASPMASITVAYAVTPKDYTDSLFYGKSAWHGKNWYCFGTSITDTSYKNAETGTPTGKYVPYLAEMSGLNVTNNGIAGGTIGKGGTYGGSAGILNRILSTDLSNADLITIEGFVNDFACEVPIGELGDTGGTDAVADMQTITICGALYRAVKHCLETAPNALVVLLTESTGKEYVMTSTGNPANYRFDLFKGEKNLCQKDYNDAIIGMGRFMGVRVIDAGGKSQINCFNPEYIIDQIHHTELGGKQYATVIWDELKNISPKVTK